MSVKKIVWLVLRAFNFQQEACDGQYRRTVLGAVLKGGSAALAAAALTWLLTGGWLGVLIVLPVMLAIGSGLAWVSDGDAERVDRSFHEMTDAELDDLLIESIVRYEEVA